MMKPDYETDSLKVYLPDWADQIFTKCEELNSLKVIDRIWQKDHTLWKPDPKEISNRLGWLDCPRDMTHHLEQINDFVDSVRSEGFTHALLMGMGGSSLAPDVFRSILGVKQGFLDLAVLDSTDPGAILAVERGLDFNKTLFIVSTKSGGTVETLSLFKYFYNQTINNLGEKKANRHFIALTDPGSSLSKLATDLVFRKTFLNDPDIGGRYSGLSFFGLVPAALVGCELAPFLDNSQSMMVSAQQNGNLEQSGNSPVWLGMVVGLLAETGRDKLTFISSPQLEPLGAWIEQLVAESTGKEGKGILPVTTEPLGSPSIYGPDRLFVFLTFSSDHSLDSRAEQFVQAGFPLVHLTIPDDAHLGAEMFRWEIATVVASHILNINPFDQPNVESAKILAKQMVSEYRQKGTIPRLEPAFTENEIAVVTSSQATSISNVLADILDITTGTDRRGRPYIAVQAFVKPSPDIESILTELTEKLRARFKLATTFGYGPRFLHSTGQLHKGDAGFGIFIQITAHMPEDANIPDEPGKKESAMSFAVLKDAQAIGDRQALIDNDRSVIRFELSANLERDLTYLVNTIA